MKKTALITGASSDLGYELAKLFAKASYDLILVDISQEKLKLLGESLHNKFGISFFAIANDLCEPKSCLEIHKILREKSIHVDVLVNNAGIGIDGYFAETDISSELNIIQINAASLTYLTKLFLKDMIISKHGKILNIASTAAFHPGPLMSVYYASKAYVLSFSEAIAEELKGTGVTVSVLCPGPIRGSSQLTERIGKSELLSKNLSLDVAQIAKAGYSGLMSGKTIIIPGIKNKIIAQLTRILPRNLITKAVKRIQESRER